MQSVIGALRVNLGLDSAQFDKGAKKAQTTTQRLAKGFTVITAAAAGVGAALGALAARSLQTIDAQAKLAQSFGTTVSSIQVLQRAADLSGVSIGQVEQAAGQLTRRLSQAAQGTGPAVKALEALNLTAAQLQSVPLDQRIVLIQEALGKFVPEAERAAVASQLFGDRAGLVFTRIDPATLALANDELTRFNVLVSDSDADQIERTNDALSTLSLIGQGLGNQIAVALAPALERLAVFLQDVTAKGSIFSDILTTLATNADILIVAATSLAGILTAKLAFSATAAAAAFIGLTGPVGIAVGLLAAVGAGAVIVARTLGDTEDSAYDAQAGTVALNAALGTFASTGAPTAAREAIELANANYQLAASAVDAARAELAKRRAVLEAADADLTGSGRRRDQRNARGEVGAAEERLAAAEAALATATADRTRAATAVTGATFDAAGAQDVLNANLELGADLLDKISGTGGGGGGGGGAAGATSALEELGRTAEETGEKVNALAVTGEQVADGLAGVFSGAITGAKDLRQGLADLATQLADQFLQAGLKSLIGSAFGGAGGAAGGLLSAFGIGQNATGTPSWRGGLTMVGERGPELMNVPRGTEIFDAGRTRSILSDSMAQPAPIVNVTPRIVNVFDPGLVGDYLGTPEGERLIVNVMERNRGAMGA